MKNRLSRLYNVVFPNSGPTWSGYAVIANIRLSHPTAGAQGASVKFEGDGIAPLVPTPAPVVEVAINAAEIKPGDVVYDLGAGDGRVMLRAAEAGAKVVMGWEQHPERYKQLVARFKEHALRICALLAWSLRTLSLSTCCHRRTKPLRIGCLTT